MRRLYDEGRAGDGGVVAGGRVIRPCAGAVLILPLAHGHVLQVRGQGRDRKMLWRGYYA